MGEGMPKGSDSVLRLDRWTQNHFIRRFMRWGISGLMKKQKRKMRTKNASAGDGLLANPRIVARRQC